MTIPPTPHLDNESSFSAHLTTVPTIIDSGTTTHIHPTRSLFSTYSKSSGRTNGFGAGKSFIDGCGEAHLHGKLPNGKLSLLRLQETYHVPDAKVSLISISHLDHAGCYTIFGNGKLICFEANDQWKLLDKISSTKKLVFTSSLLNDQLYYLDTPNLSNLHTTFHTTSSPLSKLELLHQCLGHLAYGTIKSMVRKGMILGIKLTKAELATEPPVCAACALGKTTHASFPPLEGGNRATRFLGRIHCDTWGASTCPLPWWLQVYPHYYG